MASKPIPAMADWRPYVATAVALAAAMALNLATANGLWLGYTLVGTTVFLVVVGLVRATTWRPPTRAVWMVGLAASLHYVGGSLSGLHQVGGPNGLYYAFPWWDNLVHGVGSAALGAGAAAALVPVLAGRRALATFLATAVASLIGVAVELYEFAQYLWFGTVDQGFYTNTLVDLYSNLVGGAAGAVLYARGAPAPTSAAPSAAAAPPQQPPPPNGL